MIFNVLPLLELFFPDPSGQGVLLGQNPPPPVSAHGVYPPFTLSGPTTKKTLLLCVSSLTKCINSKLTILYGAK